MPTILKTKNSVTTTVVPTTLQQGELAVNITDKKLWVGNAATTPVQLLGAGVTGDVVGPASSTDNAVARFDGTTGKIIQNSAVTIADTTGDITTAGYLITAAGAVGTPALTTTGDTNTGIFFPAADTIAFTEGGVEAMRISSNGDLGIGTTAPATPIDVVSNAQAIGIRIRGRSSDSYGLLEFTNNAASAETGRLAVDSSDNIIFSNTASVTERMRIDSSGNLLVGTTTSWSGDARFEGRKADGAGWGVSAYKTADVNTAGGALLCRVDNTASSLVAFYSSTTAVGTITTNGTITIYGTTSDYRLKTVIAPVTNAGQRIDALQPIEYDWNTGGRTRGFLAHQFAEVYPNSVSGEKDAIDADGKPVYQGMQASTPEVMADLIAEIQSLRKRVAQLESK